jgi:hypothetical protein
MSDMILPYRTSSAFDVLSENPRKTPEWSKSAGLAIGVVASLLDLRFSLPVEPIHLDHAQQRIFRRALRRSSRIIA